MDIKNQQRLSGKVCVITGSGGGIGRVEALHFAAEGAQVVVNDIGKTESGRFTADEVVDEIREAGGEAVSAPYSIATMEGAQQIINCAIEQYGKIDILVNNAGLKAANPIEHISENQWDRIVDSHLKGAFALTKFAVPHFKKQQSGVIVNIGSESGLGHPFNSAYASAKEGMVGLTRSVARELGRFGIRCNLIRPRAGSVSGPTAKAYSVWQPVIQALGPYALGNRGNLRELTYPEQVAPLVVWLATDKAQNVNGRSFFVSGDEVGLWSEPELTRVAVREGGWNLDALDTSGEKFLTAGLANDFLIENPLEGDDPFHEHLQ